MTTSSYMLDNAWGQARRRLSLLEQCYDPATFRFLTGLGVGRGWRCLEVAGGGGSVTRWLCSRVGRDGRVVAVDLDTRFLEETEAPNLTVERCDVVRDPLPDGRFDLVHVRALLMHLHEREDVLDRLVEVLRPGGWLLVEEPDLGLIDSVDTGPLRATLKALARAMAPFGFTLEFGRRLPELLQARGLVGLRCEADGCFVPGRSPMAELYGMTFVQLLEQADLPEADRAAADQALADLDDPERWFPGVPMVAAAGRRPTVGRFSGPGAGAAPGRSPAPGPG